MAEEKSRRAWRQENNLSPVETQSWGSIIKQATMDQVEKREQDAISQTRSKTGRLYIGGDGDNQWNEIYYMDSEGQFWDEISNKKLNANGVIADRLEEIKQVHSHRVYKKVPIQECWDRTGKAPIKTKWVDINKGDELNEEYRSRLVAKEIKTDKRTDLFAATPPLEAKKILFSLATTEGYGYLDGQRQSGMKLDFIDISRAYFQAAAIRDVYVELPDEDAEPGMCGKLIKSMYGTRDAAQNWGEEYAKFMVEIIVAKNPRGILITIIHLIIHIFVVLI